MAGLLSSRRRFLVHVGGAAAATLTGCASPVRSGRPTLWPDPPPKPSRASDEHVPGVEPLPDEPTPVDTTPVLDLPPRAADAETGSAFLDRTEGLGRSAMDSEILEAILAGNVPAYQRRLVPVTLEAGGRSATLHVTCDYLAVGSDDDFVRMPMTSAAAQRIANRVGATLPTPKLVDEIYRQAPAKLPPSWIDGGPTYGTLADYRTHNDTLERKRRAAGFELGGLLAGHKKDIVLAEVLDDRPNRVAIYGWHKREGVVVQPVSTSHSCRYADYSHGIRLVDQLVMVDGQAQRASDILQDPELAHLLSDEGPLPVIRYSTELPPYEPTGGGRQKAR